MEVSWKEALEYSAQKLQEHKDGKFGMIASGQDTLEDNYSLQKFTRKVMWSNHVDMHGSYPLREIPEQIHKFRMLQATAGLADIEKADAILLQESDQSWSLSHPYFPLCQHRIPISARE